MAYLDVPNLVRRRLRIRTALLTITVLGAALATSAHAYVPGVDEPTPSNYDLVAPLIPGAPADARVPAASCAANPWASHCPAVDEVVVLPSSTANTAAPAAAASDPLSDVDPASYPGLELVPYVPHDWAQQRDSSVSTQQYLTADTKAATEAGPAPPGYACALESNVPRRSWDSAPGDYFVYAGARHYCKYGVGVSYQEVGTTLYSYVKKQYSTALDNDYDTKYGGGFTRALYVGYDCNHATLRTYKNSSYGYSVVRGRGYYLPEEHKQNYTC